MSERLKQRLNQGKALYNEKRIRKIIVSEGLGQEGYSEGKEMKKYLAANNIPTEKIIFDNYGNDTQKTVNNSIRIMESLIFKSAITVSQYFHQTRTKKLLKKNGFLNIEGSSPEYF